jgi:hypothetical protein
LKELKSKIATIKEMERSFENIDECLLSLEKDDWKRLFAFIPEIEQCKQFVVSGGIEIDKGDSLSISPIVEAKVVWDFENLLIDLGLIIGFDWANWEEGKQIVSEGKYQNLDTVTLMKVIIAIQRSNHFNDGALASRFQDGTILKILKQLKMNANDLEHNMEYDLLKELHTLFPDIVSPIYPFPTPVVGKNEIKAIVLGADPTHLIDKKPEVFKEVFGLEEDNSPYWRAMAKNLKVISLDQQYVYVQNLCRNYFLQETSKNKYWKQIARDYWAPFLKQELDTLFKPDVPILMTTEFILHAVLKDTKKKIKASEIYSKLITISKEDNLLGRELIAFYRHPKYALPNWSNYNEFVANIIT